MMQHTRIFELQNPWRQNKPFFNSNSYIPRQIYDDIKKWLGNDDIIVLIGARQTGKSTLIYKTIFELLENRIDPKNIFYFNLDNLLLHELLNNIPDFVDFMEELGNQGHKYIFIDEIQRLENSGLFLKQLYDLHLPVKIIVSGSSALEIRSGIKESLTGRKKILEVRPLSIKELNRFEVQIDSSWDFGDLNKMIQKQRYHSHKLNSLCNNLIVYGGYPKIYLQKEPENKIIELHEIYQSYLQKDIVNFLKITEPVFFNKLLLLLAHQIGSIVNIQEIASSLQINRKLVQHYLYIIATTYVADLVQPYFSNKRQEVIKSQKIYYLDCGLRNFIVDNFTSIDNRADKGALIENFIFQELIKLKTFHTSIKFWRTQNMAEVDFILTKADKFIPVEVKSGALQQPKTGKAILNFINKYNPDYAFILNQDFIYRKTYGDCEIYFMPYSWFLLFFDSIIDQL